MANPETVPEARATPPRRTRLPGLRRAGWRWLSSLTLAALTCSPAATAAPQSCEPATLKDRSAGSCSVSSMVAGLDAGPLVWLHSGQPASVVPPSDSDEWHARYSDIRSGPFPGQGRLRFSGLVQASGAACSDHVQALDSADAQPAPMENLDVEALPKAMRDKIRQAKQRAEEARQAAANQRAQLASAGTGVVLKLFSPQRGLFELAIQPLGASIFARRDYASIAGWPSNSSGKVTIVLPGTEHTDLAPGETFEAVVRGKDQALYSDTRGRLREFPRDAGAMAKRRCRQGKQYMAARWQNFSAVVAEAQGEPCNRKAYFEGTTRRASAAELTGEVTITAITDERVTGRFRLNGQARLETSRYRFTRDQAPEADQIFYPKPGSRELKQVRTDETRQGGLTVSGHFAAPNTISGLADYPNYRDGSRQPRALEARTVVVPTNQGNGGGKGNQRAPLRVDSHLPRAGKRNVSGTQPGITLTFNHRVEPSSLSNNTLSLGYRNAQGALEQVPVRIEREGKRRVRLAPKLGLKDGVRYRVTAHGGAQGIQSVAGESLPTDYRWAFYTLVDLDRAESVPAAGAHLRGRAGVEPHVFQVARDAPLVPGKSTLTRVYPKWRGDRTVAENWQVKHFLADVRVKGDGPLYPAKERVLLERPDQWTEPQRRRAANSVNFFNWRPRSSDGATLTAEVEPVEQCRDEPRVFESAPLDLDYASLSKSLDIDYYIVRASDWAGDALTSGNAQWAPAAAHRIAAEGASFTTQNFPVLRTNMRYQGTVTADTGTVVTNQGGNQRSGVWPNQWRTDKWLIHQIKQKLQRFNSSADAVMLFFSGAIRAAGGQSYEERAFVRDWIGNSQRPQLQTGLFGLFLHRDYANMVSKGIVDVAHELGHILLDDEKHLARNAWLTNYANTAGQRIEGFRLRQRGNGGTNKSTTEGNGSPKGSKVLPLMVAGQTPEAATFITNDNYERLIETIAEPPSRVTRRHLSGGSVRLASTGDETPRGLNPVWLVQGLIQPDGDRARIDEVSPERGPVTAPASGTEWQVNLLGDAGHVLASAPARGRCRRTSTPDACPFTVRLPRQDGVAAVTVTRDGQLAARRDRTTAAPRLTVAEPTQQGRTTQLQWQASDSDSATLRFDVSYSRDGEQYRPLALGLSERQLSVPTAELAPGPAPQLRVTASDGFNVHRQSVRLAATAGLRVLATQPHDTAMLAPHGNVEIMLNAALDPASVTPDTIRLLSPDNERLPIRVHYRPRSQTIRVAPTADLEEGVQYTGVVTDDVRTNRGASLAQAHRWTFTPDTAAADNPITRQPSGQAKPPVEQGEGGEPSAQQGGNAADASLSLGDNDIASMPFNATKVRYWIKARIATNRLQDNMRANADDYDRLIPAFYRKRKMLLEQAGWNVADFEATGNRIRRASSAIALSREENRPEYGTDPIEATREDWPAVKPYLDKLEHLTDWVADNVEQPPRLD